MLCCFPSSPFYLLELFLQIKVLSMHSIKRSMNSIHIASVISNLRNSLVWGWGLGGEGVVRVVLEATPLVVAWVKVQPRLPPALNRYWIFLIFFGYSISSIGVCGTFVSFCSLGSLIWSDSFLLVHLLCFVFREV